LGIGTASLFASSLTAALHRGGMGELGKDDEAHGQKRRGPGDAASIIASMRSVFTDIWRRSSGFGRSV